MLKIILNFLKNLISGNEIVQNKECMCVYDRAVNVSDVNSMVFNF